MGFFARLFGKKPQAETTAETKPDAETDAAQTRADALIAEGNALEETGQIEAALGKYQQALDAAPGYWRAFLNLGIGHDLQKNTRESLHMLRQAHALNPQTHVTCYNLGRALVQAGEFAQAIAPLEQALVLKPGFFDALIVLAEARENNGQPNEALQLLDQALMLQPGHPGALRNKAFLLKDEYPDMAEEILEKLVDTAPDVLTGYAQLLLARGEAEPAVQFHQRAFEHAQDAASLGALLMATCYAANTDNAQLLAWHRKINPLLDKTGQYTHEYPQKWPSENEKIRVGFISPDFRRHPVAYFAESLLENIDKEKFDVFLYSSHHTQDDLTGKFKSLAPHWREISDLNARDAARQIAEDQIEILIDLAGHTAENRRDVMALKPAPIQATWLGYIATTGLDEMDFRIADEVSDPPGMTESQHAETLMRLPAPYTQWCYKPQPDTPPVAPLPALKNGHITFGSFNQCAKLSEPCLAMWAQLMQQVPGSRIRFTAIAEGRARQRISDFFARHGITSERLAFAPRVPWNQYFDSFGQVDIALDSWPYTGGTTTCDTLMMGVPVITLSGARSVSRSGASLLTALGHPEWVAETPEQFAQIGARLAADTPALAQLRETLRPAFLASPIADGPGFARRFEAALLHMREQRRAAQPS